MRDLHSSLHDVSPALPWIVVVVLALAIPIGSGVAAIAVLRRLGLSAALDFVWGVRVNLTRALRYDRQGRMSEALDASRHALAGLPVATCPWHVLNVIVGIMISAGRYREALAARRRWPRVVRDKPEPATEYGQALTCLSLVEALYNLGKLAAAKRLLSRIESACRRHALSRNCHVLQHARLLTLEGRASEALEAVKHVVASELSSANRSELHFTRAAALRDIGAFEDADAEVRLGMVSGERASSQRNGIFLLGTIARARGDLASAVRELERGMAHRYRGQGGDSMLQLAGCYEKLGQLELTARTYGLLLRRDPESGAAKGVRLRLKKRARKAEYVA